MPLNGALSVADEFKSMARDPRQTLQTKIEQRRQLNQPNNANDLNPSAPDWLQISHPQVPIPQQARNAENAIMQNRSVNEIGNAANSAVAASVQYKQEAAARRALANQQALSERQKQLLTQFGNLDFSGSGGGLNLGGLGGSGSANGPDAQNISGKRGLVIAMGKRLLGQPYQWAGGHGTPRIGPVDCSGLVRYAFIKAGITSIPGVSQTQMGWGTPTSISRLLPGDLVGHNHPATHVAIYLGGGKILEAQQTGTRVHIRSIGNGAGWWGVHLNY